jgi:hypothetical protein
MLAVDCHPWNGLVGLAILTASEVAQNPALADPAEMAAWRHYDFSQELTAWQSAAVLASEMKDAYYAGDRPNVADAFMAACADALSSPQVAEALELLGRSNDFRLSVAHPDDGREFVRVS